VAELPSPLSAILDEQLGPRRSFMVQGHGRTIDQKNVGDRGTPQRARHRSAPPQIKESGKDCLRGRLPDRRSGVEAPIGRSRKPMSALGSFASVGRV